MLLRTIVGRPVTLSHTFDVDGVATDPAPDTATVTITTATGTVLVNAANATEAGTGKFTYTFTPTALDVLSVTWVSSLGTATDVLEVAGDFLFTVQEARDKLGDPAYDASKIAEARLYAETELENAVGYALVPRYALDARDAIHGAIRLRPYVRVIRSVTVAGVVLDAGTVAGLSFSGGFLRGYRWPSGYGNVVVGYEHGMGYRSPGATRAALALAVEYLGGADSTIDPRAESITTVDGTLRLRSALGQFGPVGVNEWVEANRLPVMA